MYKSQSKFLILISWNLNWPVFQIWNGFHFLHRNCLKKGFGRHCRRRLNHMLGTCHCVSSLSYELHRCTRGKSRMDAQKLSTRPYKMHQPIFHSPDFGMSAACDTRARYESSPGRCTVERSRRPRWARSGGRGRCSKAQSPSPRCCCPQCARSWDCVAAGPCQPPCHSYSTWTLLSAGILRN